MAAAARVYHLRFRGLHSVALGAILMLLEVSLGISEMYLVQNGSNPSKTIGKLCQVRALNATPIHVVFSLFSAPVSLSRGRERPISKQQLCCRYLLPLLLLQVLVCLTSGGGRNFPNLQPKRGRRR